MGRKLLRFSSILKDSACRVSSDSSHNVSVTSHIITELFFVFQRNRSPLPQAAPETLSIRMRLGSHPWVHRASFGRTL